MYLLSKPYLLLCEEPLRAGASNATATFGDIDNPIQRNPNDTFPIIEGSSYRGALRDTFSRKGIDETTIRLLFGNKPNDNDQKRGTIRLSTLNVLFFPVAAPIGVQAYITCPMVLENWNRMQDIGGNEQYKISGIPPKVLHSKVVTSTKTDLKAPIRQDKIVLIHDTFTIDNKLDISSCKIENESINDWFGEKIFTDYPILKDNFINNLIIVSNDIFKIMVTNHTYVATGIAINPVTKVVDAGKLFKTEYLPQFTVMQGSIGASPEFVANKGKTVDEIMTKFTDGINTNLKGYVQIGGRSSVGKGISRIMLLNSPQTQKDNGNANS